MSTRLEQLLEFLKESPNDPFLKYAIAAEYDSSGNREEAIQHFERLVAQHPDYVGTYYHLGKLYEKVSKPERAEAVYRSGIEIAKVARKHHALSELQGALALLIADEDDF